MHMTAATHYAGHSQFGAQAEIAAPLIGMKLLEPDIPGRGVCLA